MDFIDLQELTSQDDVFYNEMLKRCLDNRILIINEEISEAIVEKYIMRIIMWNIEDKDIPKDLRKKIKLYINTPGGSSFDGWGLVSIIEESVTPVVAVSLGLVASMGYHIYISCNERYAMKNSIFLQHDGEIAVQNSGSKAKQTMQFFENMEERTKSFVLEKTNMTEEFYDSIYEQEYWFYSDRAKELGVVDKIVGIDCDIYDIV